MANPPADTSTGPPPGFDALRYVAPPPSLSGGGFNPLRQLDGIDGPALAPGANNVLLAAALAHTARVAGHHLAAAAPVAALPSARLTPWSWAQPHEQTHPQRKPVFGSAAPASLLGLAPRPEATAVLFSGAEVQSSSEPKGLPSGDVGDRGSDEPAAALALSVGVGVGSVAEHICSADLVASSRTRDIPSVPGLSKHRAAVPPPSTLYGCPGEEAPAGAVECAAPRAEQLGRCRSDTITMGAAGDAIDCEAPGASAVPGHAGFIAGRASAASDKSGSGGTEIRAFSALGAHHQLAAVDWSSSASATPRFEVAAPHGSGAGVSSHAYNTASDPYDFSAGSEGDGGHVGLGLGVGFAQFAQAAGWLGLAPACGPAAMHSATHDRGSPDDEHPAYPLEHRTSSRDGSVHAVPDNSGRQMQFQAASLHLADSGHDTSSGLRHSHTAGYYLHHPLLHHHVGLDHATLSHERAQQQGASSHSAAATGAAAGGSAARLACSPVHHIPNVSQHTHADQAAMPGYSNANAATGAAALHWVAGGEIASTFARAGDLEAATAHAIATAERAATAATTSAPKRKRLCDAGTL